MDMMNMKNVMYGGTINCFFIFLCLTLCNSLYFYKLCFMGTLTKCRQTFLLVVLSQYFKRFIDFIRIMSNFYVIWRFWGKRTKRFGIVCVFWSKNKYRMYRICVFWFYLVLVGAEFNLGPKIINIPPYKSCRGLCCSDICNLVLVVAEFNLRPKSIYISTQKSRRGDFCSSKDIK